MKIRVVVTGVALVFSLYACGDGDSGNGGTGGSSVSFSADVQPIFNANCTGCHTSGGAASFLPLTEGNSYANLVSQADGRTDAASGYESSTLVVPGDSANSVLYQRISAIGMAQSEEQMPLGGSPLSSTDQGLIKGWIDEGALND